MMQRLCEAGKFKAVTNGGRGAWGTEPGCHFAGEGISVSAFHELSRQYTDPKRSTLKRYNFANFWSRNFLRTRYEAEFISEFKNYEFKSYLFIVGSKVDRFGAPCKLVVRISMVEMYAIQYSE